VNESPIASQAEWEAAIRQLPQPHLLQTWPWGALKEKYGWSAERLAWGQPGAPLAAAQILHRTQRLPLWSAPLTVSYCPRGPILDWANATLRGEVLDAAAAAARRRRAIFLKIDPGLPVGYGDPNAEGAALEPLGTQVADTLSSSGWRPSAEQIQFRNTFTLDLRRSEDELLAGMKQKTRYNIRLAERRGVSVRRGGLDDLDLLYRMYAETAVRDGFAIRSADYYRDAWGTFIRDGLAQPLVAEAESQPIAGLVVYRYAANAWYLYGMSRDRFRELMPNHLLQWEAIRWARAQGCATYDFWGAPDRLAPTDRLWGVYRFKEGFGAKLVRTSGAWDFPLRPALYSIYSVILPRLMSVWRWRGRRQTRQAIDA